LGWSNTFTYKSFDLDIFLRGVFGHDMVNTYKLFYQPPNQITSYNVLQSAFDITELTTSPQFSSFQVEDASFVRLQNATLGDNAPTAEHSLVRDRRIYRSPNKPFTITGYDGSDPEVIYVDGGNPLAARIERHNRWYTARTFTLGINSDFYPF